MFNKRIDMDRFREIFRKNPLLKMRRETRMLNWTIVEPTRFTTKMKGRECSYELWGNLTGNKFDDTASVVLPFNREYREYSYAHAHTQITFYRNTTNLIIVK